jgi:hypothetical protein
MIRVQTATALIHVNAGADDTPRFAGKDATGSQMMLSDTTLTLIILVAVLGFASVAIRSPIRTRLKNWLSADSGFEPCEGNHLGPDVARIIAALRELGFVLCGHWHHSGHSHATGQITLMEHPQTLDVAKVMVVVTATHRDVTLVFETRFEDGTKVGTANNQITAGLPSLPETTSLWLPEVRDARQLYRVHDQVRDRVGLGKKRLSIGPDPAAFLTAGRDHMLARFVETGYYYLDEPRGVYRPTWKGAVLMTWRLLWPIRPLYRAWRRRPTRRLLREEGLELELD